MLLSVFNLGFSVDLHEKTSLKSGKNQEIDTENSEQTSSRAAEVDLFHLFAD